ncbi:MAG: GIY-YIG nuclease family protein [Clostridia bacterium]|nr:GIY-YIG nuclease family protein [Clostridia bacterium]
MHYVYILKCHDDTYYTGWTTDLEKRLHTHNEGEGAKYTRSRRPVELVYFEEFHDKSSALKRECAIKALSRTQKELLIHQSKNL